MKISDVGEKRHVVVGVERAICGARFPEHSFSLVDRDAELLAEIGVLLVGFPVRWNWALGLSLSYFGSFFFLTYFYKRERRVHGLHGFRWNSAGICAFFTLSLFASAIICTYFDKSFVHWNVQRTRHQLTRFDGKFDHVRSDAGGHHFGDHLGNRSAQPASSCSTSRHPAGA